MLAMLQLEEERLVALESCEESEEQLAYVVA